MAEVVARRRLRARLANCCERPSAPNRSVWRGGTCIRVQPSPHRHQGIIISAMSGKWVWILVALLVGACSKTTVILKEPRPLKISAKAPEEEEPPPPPPKRIEVKQDRVEVSETILFKYSSSWLADQSHDILDELAKVLNAHPEIKRVRIEGHTDTQGGAPQNLRLSKKRAKAVMKYLVKQGVDAKRLVAEGYGQTKPIADNDTDEGRAKNRRVVFTILERDKSKAGKGGDESEDEDTKKDAKEDTKQDTEQDTKQDTQQDDDDSSSDDEEKP
jgi:outer membrane protein OmpA-like peptidoglycan-associated protein